MPKISRTTFPRMFQILMLSASALHNLLHSLHLLLLLNPSAPFSHLHNHPLLVVLALYLDCCSTKWHAGPCSFGRRSYAPPAGTWHMRTLYCALNNSISTLSLISFLPSSLCFALSVLQTLAAGDLVKWDPNGNGYYIYPKARWYVESGRYDEKGAGGGLGQWDRDHHYDVWGKVNRTTKE